MCATLRPMDSRTRVVFLQHPREARMPVSTCRLAHLSLPNSEMHVAMRPEGTAHLEALASEPGTMLLFPGPGSTDVTELATPPRTLIVVDGTWINARKVVERSPMLSALPRIGFTPSKPGNYRIRKEPADHCLSTIEAVAYVLEALEDAPGRFTPILGSFDRMVDLQLEYIATRPQTRPPRPPKGIPEGRAAIERLRQRGDQVLLVFAGGNAWSEASGLPGPAELLHWVAIRPFTGERFECVLKPRRPVAAYVPERLDVSSAALDEGETVEDALARWYQFVSADDVLCTWGKFATDLLRAEGIGASVEAGAAEYLDLKRLASGLRNARLGGVEQVAERLGATIPEADRATRTLTALEVVVRGLLENGLRGMPA